MDLLIKLDFKVVPTDQYGDKHGNDIITAIDNHNVTYMEDLVSYIDENKQPGEKLSVTVFRNQTYTDLSVELGDRSNSTKTDSNSTKTDEGKDPYN